MLFEPFELKDKVLRNRVVSAPLASSSSLPDGTPSEKSIEVYKRFAASGTGLVVVEHHAVHFCGRTRPTQFLADNDETAKAHAKISGILKDSGAVAIVQINHCGANVAEAAVFDDPEYRAFSPSGVPIGRCWNSIKQKPYVLQVYEIKQLIEVYVNAAVRMVKLGGYDGVQIHASHGYLLGQFLSPLTNKRDDEYGGSDAKRARFLYEVADGVRQSLPEAIVSVRLGAADYLPGEPSKGLSLDETVPVARELAGLGMDMIGISGNICGYGLDRTDDAYFAPYAARIRDAIGGSVPVECTGGIRTAYVAEKLLKEKVCDLVGVGRLMLKDPEFLSKWREDLD
ncbi:MAG: NADH:flavin oxidoreductase [Synergistaceae bacterium]|nr:NADH:flavin oxidoreductase [Synergistaceae bacterium]